MRRAGFEVRKAWGRVRREWRELRMEARRVARLEAFSIIALGGHVSEGFFGRSGIRGSDGRMEVAIPVNDGYKR